MLFVALAPVEIKGAALRADRLAVNQNQFRIRLPILFHDVNELPFSVLPAILFKVDPMSKNAIHGASDSSRSSITGRANGADYPLASGSLRQQLGFSRMDRKLDSKGRSRSVNL